MLLTRALSSLGTWEMQLYFSAYSIKSSSGFVAIKSFIVLCNQDTKHLVEITVFKTNLLYTLLQRRRCKGIQSDFYKMTYSKQAGP